MNTQRPSAVTVAVVLLALLSVVTMVPPSLMAPPAEAAEVPAFVTYLGVILGVVGLVAAYGLWALKRWSVWLTIILSAVSILLSVPPILFGPTAAIQVVNIASDVAFALVVVLVLLPASRRAYTSGGYASEVDKPLGKRVKGEHR
jgi:uncharacterized membrane protein (DUF2068 family)